MPTNPDPDIRFPVGYVRPGARKLYGWKEVVDISERTDASVRQMRREMEAFPTPYCVTSTTPLYVASEIDTFFARNPRRTLVTEDLIRSMQGLVDGGSSYRRAAQILDVNVNTVAKYAAPGYPRLH